MKKITLFLVSGALLSPGCVVMRDPIYLNYAPVTITETDPADPADPPGNTSEPASATSASSPSNIAQESKEKKPVKKTTLACPIFHSPPFGEPPRMMAQDFDKIDPNDKDALIKALTTHAEKLYLYSKNYRDWVNKERIQQNKACR